MGGWTDNRLGITDDTRADVERRKPYVQVLNLVPAEGVIDHLCVDGSHPKIYIQPHARSAESE